VIFVTFPVPIYLPSVSRPLSICSTNVPRGNFSSPDFRTFNQPQSDARSHARISLATNGPWSAFRALPTRVGDRGSEECHKYQGSGRSLGPCPFRNLIKLSADNSISSTVQSLCAERQTQKRSAMSPGGAYLAAPHTKAPHWSRPYGPGYSGVVFFATKMFFVFSLLL
jgi:hypothetical protein